MNTEIKILYVEDEEFIREEMIEILELNYKNIYVAKNGAEALEMYKQYKPDITISDVQMPLMDGMKMSKEIKVLNPKAKIILTTAFNEKSFISNAKELGINNYISKPVNIPLLFKTIEECIEEGV